MYFEVLRGLIKTINQRSSQNYSNDHGGP